MRSRHSKHPETPADQSNDHDDDPPFPKTSKGGSNSSKSPGKTKETAAKKKISFSPPDVIDKASISSSSKEWSLNNSHIISSNMKVIVGQQSSQSSSSTSSNNNGVAEAEDSLDAFMASSECEDAFNDAKCGSAITMEDDDENSPPPSSKDVTTDAAAPLSPRYPSRDRKRSTPFVSPPSGSSPRKMPGYGLGKRRTVESPKKMPLLGGGGNVAKCLPGFKIPKSKISDNFQVSPEKSLYSSAKSPEDCPGGSSSSSTGVGNVGTKLSNSKFGFGNLFEKLSRPLSEREAEEEEEEEEEYTSLFLPSQVPTKSGDDGDISSKKKSSKGQEVAENRSSDSPEKSSTKATATRRTPAKRSPSKKVSNDLGETKPQGEKFKKASSVFNADELMAEEYRQIKESAPAKSDVNARKRYLARYRKVFKGLITEDAAAAASRSPGRKRKVSPTKSQDKKKKKSKRDGQRSMLEFLSPVTATKNGGGSQRLSNASSSSENDDDDDNDLGEDDDVCWNSRLLRIDEILASQDAADDTTNMEEYFEMIRERNEVRKKEEEEEKKSEEEKMKQEKKRMKVLEENRQYRDRLDEELNESETRSLVRGYSEFIQDLWDGKVESHRYEAFKRGGLTRRALLYCTITSAFSESHIDWIVDEITLKWMPTTRQHSDHNDFVWKVILAETLIKIYMDLFGFDKEEAEERMRNTSSRPDES